MDKNSYSIADPPLDEIVALSDIEDSEERIQKGLEMLFDREEAKLRLLAQKPGTSHKE